MSGTPRQLIIVTAAVALIVGVVAALGTGEWLLLPAVMAVHALASALVVGYTLRTASQSEDKPDPVTQARQEEQRGASSDEPSLKMREGG